MISYFGDAQMKQDIKNGIHQINYLTAEIDALYHQAAVKLNLSDSVMRVLYTICDNGESCLLRDIYRQSGISKQTVNSAIRRLEKDEIIYLEKYNGRAKKVILTPKGKELADRTIAHIFKIEHNVFSSWSNEDFSAYIALTERFAEALRENIEKMQGQETAAAKNFKA